MERNIEAAWRKGLEARGRDWVEAELRKRAGQPADVVLDVVFEEPYPTREFCQRWSAERDNMFHLSGHTKAIIIALVVFIIFGIKAINSWDNRPTEQHQMR